MKLLVINGPNLNTHITSIAQANKVRARGTGVMTAGVHNRLLLSHYTIITEQLMDRAGNGGLAVVAALSVHYENTLFHIGAGGSIANGLL